MQVIKFCLICLFVHVFVFGADETLWVVNVFRMEVEQDVGLLLFNSLKVSSVDKYVPDRGCEFKGTVRRCGS